MTGDFLMIFDELSNSTCRMSLASSGAELEGSAQTPFHPPLTFPLGMEIQDRGFNISRYGYAICTVSIIIVKTGGFGNVPLFSEW